MRSVAGDLVIEATIIKRIARPLCIDVIDSYWWIGPEDTSKALSFSQYDYSLETALQEYIKRMSA
jgi:hypothetical protein